VSNIQGISKLLGRAPGLGSPNQKGKN